MKLELPQSDDYDLYLGDERVCSWNEMLAEMQKWADITDGKC
jgi:hypothetical protein